MNYLRYIFTTLLLFNSTLILASKGFDIVETVEKYGVVFIGESHTQKNHKDLAIDFISAMPTNPKIDTFAFEHGLSINQAALEQFISDKEAPPGSLKELYYICKLSNDSRKDFSFEDFKSFN